MDLGAAAGSGSSLLAEFAEGASVPGMSGVGGNG